VLPHEFTDLMAALAGVAGNRGSGAFVHGAKYRLVVLFWLLLQNETYLTLRFVSFLYIPKKQARGAT
jgi:hypothetical protein